MDLLAELVLKLTLLFLGSVNNTIFGRNILSEREIFRSFFIYGGIYEISNSGKTKCGCCNATNIKVAVALYGLGGL